MRWAALRPRPSPSLLDRIFGKTVPVWLVVAIVLFFILWTVAFAWFVKRSIHLDDERLPARVALEIASFPSHVKKVFLALRQQLSGKLDYSVIGAFPPDHMPSDLSPVKSKLAGVAEGLLVRRGPGAPARGWRVIAGVFEIDGSLQTAAVLLSPDLEIIHYWPLIEDAAIGVDYEPALRKFPHGLSVLRDGSVIYNFDNGLSLHRKDKCGRTMWAIPGDFHHSVTLDETETTAWAIQRRHQFTRIVQIVTADGKILTEISMAAIIAANPEIDILEIRRLNNGDLPGNPRQRPGRWLNDPIHLNDVDPLPRSLADKFPMFSPGDLLISARETNLIFVMDPASLAIKWWLIGATIRQHDGDWNRNGQLSVFNNRTARDYSGITRVDPATYVTTLAVDGRNIDFYSRRRGNHQLLPEGGWLITSTEQGRVIELSPNGDIALEFYNRLKEEPGVYTILSSASFFSEEVFKPGAVQCGEN